jgi:hypothetical protein
MIIQVTPYAFLEGVQRNPDSSFAHPVGLQGAVVDLVSDCPFTTTKDLSGLFDCASFHPHTSDGSLVPLDFNEF